MRQDDSYKKFRDVIFQELEDIRRMATEAAVEDFVRWAGTKGFSLE